MGNQTMTKAKRIYKIPQEAIEALGIRYARESAREMLLWAKRCGLSFEEACDHVDEYLLDAAEYVFQETPLDISFERT